MSRVTLPEFCAARHPVTDAWILIKRGEAGYAPWPHYIPPDEYNQAHGIDEAVVETMISCSMSGGWEKADVVSVRRSLERGRERKAREAYRPRRRWSES